MPKGNPYARIGKKIESARSKLSKLSAELNDLALQVSAEGKKAEAAAAKAAAPKKTAPGKASVARKGGKTARR